MKSVTDVPIRACYPLDPTEGPMAINFARRIDSLPRSAVRSALGRSPHARSSPTACVTLAYS